MPIYVHSHTCLLSWHAHSFCLRFSAGAMFNMAASLSGSCPVSPGSVRNFPVVEVPSAPEDTWQFLSAQETQDVSVWGNGSVSLGFSGGGMPPIYFCPRTKKMWLCLSENHGRIDECRGLGGVSSVIADEARRVARYSVSSPFGFRSRRLLPSFTLPVINVAEASMDEPCGVCRQWPRCALDDVSKVSTANTTSALKYLISPSRNAARQASLQPSSHLVRSSAIMPSECIQTSKEDVHSNSQTPEVCRGTANEDCSPHLNSHGTHTHTYAQKKRKMLRVV